ncbi:hypothetical protein [Parapedobacter sp. 2B3]|uniref:hypothetical protein n=1 Tax=Parapedobacter sp. 2B3 TaxID=3342381 RepID=UPI0035B5F0BA
MKQLALLSMVLFASCQQAATFDFLVGEWTRTNEEAGKQTLESWVKRNDSTYVLYFQSS